MKVFIFSAIVLVAAADLSCTSDAECPGSYCMNDPSKSSPFSCHDTKTPGVPLKNIGKDVHGEHVLLPMMGLGTWQVRRSTTPPQESTTTPKSLLPAPESL